MDYQLFEYPMQEDLGDAPEIVADLLDGQGEEYDSSTLTRALWSVTGYLRGQADQRAAGWQDGGDQGGGDQGAKKKALAKGLRGMASRKAAPGQDFLKNFDYKQALRVLLDLLKEALDRKDQGGAGQAGGAQTAPSQPAG